MKYILSILAFFIFGIYTQAQIQPCSTGEMREQAHKMFPELIQKSQQFRQQMKAAMLETKAGGSTLDTVVYTIPIVFHVIHEYGNENISDQQIYDQVRILNEDYMKLNADTNLAIPFYDTIIGNARMQFRLASLDPIGNPTNGITRRYIHKSYSSIPSDDKGNFNYTKYDRWPRSQYLNVWIIGDMAEMGGTAGYAYHPVDVEGAFSFADGVMILNNFIGSIGTSNPHNSRSLTHEIGHYLGLDHVWGGTNDNDSPNNCQADDGIEDTPNCEGSPTGFCDLTRKTCEDVSFQGIPLPPNTQLPDPVQNYMDYSYCSVMFSEDQVTFMRNVLRSATAQRNMLWSESNLQNTIPEGIVYDPIADFYVENNDTDMDNNNNPLTAVGQNISFSNTSWRLVGSTSSYSWKFEDASPSTSTDENPTVTFNSPGWKNVTLTVTNNGRTNTVTKENFVYVNPTWSYDGTNQIHFDDPSRIRTNTWNPENLEYEWVRKNDAGKNGSGGIFLDMSNPHENPILNSPEYFFNQRRNGAKNSFITVPFNFEYITNASISFDWACATNATSSEDIFESLTIYFSTNYGDTWSPVTGNETTSSIIGMDLVNNGTGWASFYPSSGTTWSNQSFNILPFANGSSHIMFKFVYGSTQFSNNIAIDNINISGTLGLESASSLEDHITVYPNPSTQSEGWSIKYDALKWSGAQIKLMDLSGRIVSEGVLPNNQNSEFQLTVGPSAAKGVYILKIKNADNTTQKKLILK